MKKPQQIIGFWLVWMVTIVIVGFSSCHTVKRSQSVATHDTVRVRDTVRVVKLDSVIIERLTHDTVISLRPNNLHVSLDKDRDTDTTIRKNNLKLHVYTDSKGKQQIDCNADSLVLVIDKLSKESIRLRSDNDSVVIKDRAASSVTLKEVVATENKNIGQRVYEFLKGLFALGGLLWVVLFLGGHVIKKFTNNSNIS